MTNYAVLGAGMMGRVIAKDILASEDEARVTFIDFDENQLRAAADFVGEGIETRKVDISDTAATAAALDGHTVAVSALPHRLSLAGIKAALSAKVSLVDLVGEGPEVRAALDDQARRAEVLIIPGCGVAPGISNICVGRGIELLDETHNALIYVGGIPKEKAPPLNYQTVYLLESVFNAYLRPVEVIINGKRETVEPLSGLEPVEFAEPIGRLEAFCNNGLASLPLTLGDKITGNMFEKTMRYPGHTERILFLKQCGLLDKKPIKVSENEVVPFEFLTELLAPKLELGPQGDILVMRVIVEGLKAGKKQQHIFELIDYFDPATQYTAMARTTGFPAAVAARMIAHDRLTKKGVRFPEQLFVGDHFSELMGELAAKGVTVTHHIHD